MNKLFVKSTLIMLILAMLMGCAPNQADPTPEVSLDAALCIVAVYDKQEYSTAITACSVAIDNHPDDSSVYLARALAYFFLEDVASAIPDFTRAIELGETDLFVYSLRGEANFYNDDMESAIQDFSIALEAESDPNTLVDVVGVYHQRGVAYYQQNDTELAIDDFSSAISLDPDYEIAYLGRGMAYFDTTEFDLALADLVEYRSLLGGDVDPQLNAMIDLAESMASVDNSLEVANELILEQALENLDATATAEARASDLSTIYEPDPTYARLIQDNLDPIIPENGSQLRILAKTRMIGMTAFVFVPDSYEIIFGDDDGELWRWNLKTGKFEQIAVLPSYGRYGASITSLAYDGVGGHIAAGSEDGQVWLWSISDDGNAEQQPLIGESHTDRVSLAFAQSGSTLISVSYDGTLYFWDVNSRQIKHVIGEAGYNLDIEDIVISSDGSNAMAVANTMWSGQVWFIDANASTVLEIMYVEGFPKCGALSADDSTFFTGDRTMLVEPTAIRLYQLPYRISEMRQPSFVNPNTLLPGGERIDAQKILDDHSFTINDLALNPDGSVLASASGDGTIIVWDVASGESLIRMGNLVGNGETVAFNSEGTLLAGLDGNGYLMVWGVSPLLGD